MMQTVRHRILIVEGDADNCEGLRLILESLGYAVECARTGAGALAVCTAWHPELVVLDLGLPDIPGERVAATMKRLPAPPFIVGFSGFHRRERAARFSGCDAFVLKPNLEALLALVEEQAAMRARASGGGMRDRRSAPSRGISRRLRSPRWALRATRATAAPSLHRERARRPRATLLPTFAAGTAARP